MVGGRSESRGGPAPKFPTLCPFGEPVQSLRGASLPIIGRSGAGPRGSCARRPAGASARVRLRGEVVEVVMAVICDQRGVSYLAVLCAVVLMGVSLSAVGQQWSVVVKRDREAELVFRGARIKNAIELYAADYEVNKATRPNRYPLTLEQLTQKPKRYLPVVYKDPITGESFELIKVGAEVQGVKSRSQDVPMNKVRFKDAATYNHVAFQAEAPAAQTASTGVNPLNPLSPPGNIPTGPAPTSGSP